MAGPCRSISLCSYNGSPHIHLYLLTLSESQLGLRTVAVYSPADRLQPHRYKADEAYCVGTPDMLPVSCYLDIDSIIKVAKEAEVRIRGEDTAGGSHADP